ncbi:MAG: D-alanyl-D-alanine carboxypeptidase/D-alanyl-D-alanine-endopeptidase [Myxococcales bacterium]|nr:D-alanyl-D-alanine carboxypeptidase/D-alanyl-D-alanine-endopeptidase [Myxococcales bacterium]
MLLWVLALEAVAWAGGLRGMVKRELETEALDGAIVGVRIDDHKGRTLVDRGADVRLVPASTVKWLVAVAATDLLGFDYRFRTRLQATGHLDGDVLHGDLILKGSGDPSFMEEDARPLFASVVETLNASGIRQIRGRVLVDDSVVTDPGLGVGWMWDDARFGFSAPVSGLNIAHNVQKPGLTSCEVAGDRGTPLKEPAICVAAVLDDVLKRAKVRVRGGEVAVARGSDEAWDLVVWESAPLEELLERMLLDSDNLYAESIARALDKSPRRSFAGAREALNEVLGRAGVRPAGTRFVDGSGLSRYAMVSAGDLVQLTAWSTSQRWGRRLRQLLPVAGVSGTLEGRGAGTAAEGRVWGKTGSMSGVRNVVGVAFDQKGRPLHFALMFNGVVGPRAPTIAVQDRIFTLMAISRGGRVGRKDRIAAFGEDG